MKEEIQKKNNKTIINVKGRQQLDELKSLS